MNIKAALCRGLVAGLAWWPAAHLLMAQTNTSAAEAWLAARAEERQDAEPMVDLAEPGSQKAGPGQ